MKQFDLKEYLANPSRKVVTRSGRAVRIICTDRRGTNYPVIALVEFDWGEDPIGYTKDGKYRIRDKSDGDLFFAPEKHKGWCCFGCGLDASAKKVKNIKWEELK